MRLKTCLTLSVSSLLLGMTSCSTPIPKWEGKVYQGSSKDFGVVRRQAGEVIRADSPEFDDIIAMKASGPDGFEGFVQTYIHGCAKWKKGVVLIPAYEQVKIINQGLE